MACFRVLTAIISAALAISNFGISEASYLLTVEDYQVPWKVGIDVRKPLNTKISFWVISITFQEGRIRLPPASGGHSQPEGAGRRLECLRKWWVHDDGLGCLQIGEKCFGKLWTFFFGGGQAGKMFFNSIVLGFSLSFTYPVNKNLFPPEGLKTTLPFLYRPLTFRLCPPIVNSKLSRQQHSFFNILTFLKDIPPFRPRRRRRLSGLHGRGRRDQHPGGERPAHRDPRGGGAGHFAQTTGPGRKVSKNFDKFRNIYICWNNLNLSWFRSFESELFK